MDSLKDAIKEIVGCFKEDLSFSSDRITGDENVPFVRYTNTDYFEYEESNDQIYTRISFRLDIFGNYPEGCMTLEDIQNSVCDDLKKYRTWLNSIIEYAIKYYGVKVNGRLKNFEKIRGAAGGFRYNAYQYPKTEHRLVAVRLSGTLVIPNAECKCDDNIIDKACLPNATLSFHEQLSNG